MSFSNLMSGAECSTSTNPLNQFSKHVGQDKSLQGDRFVPGAGPIQGMRADVPISSQDQKARIFALHSLFQMMDQFFRPEAQPNTFGFDRMRRELNHIQAQHPASLHTQTPPPEWMSEFSRPGSAPPLQLRPEERARMENVFRTHPMSTNHTWQNEFLTQPPPDVVQHFHTMPPASDAAFMRDFGARFDMYSGPGMHSSPTMTDVKGKSKMVELDDTKWEEQFRAFEDTMKDDEANKAIDDELNAQENEQFFGDFQSIWNGIRAEEAEKLAGGDVDFLDRFNDESFDTNDVFDGKPDLGDYLFEPDNPYMNHPDPFTEGVRLMEVGGSLSEAALCFEAVCQLESKRVDGWTYLGAVQAQNEKELAAIRALEQAIRLDESNLPALMNLAVSYTNEGYDTSAYLTLEQWLSTKYPSLGTTQQPPFSSNYSRSEIHQRVTDLFIRAAQLSPNGADMDADVQVGLGVLFYGDEEYDKAIDCFSAALSTRPNDHLLWNRLGATLANSGKSEEAIDAYHRALDLKPTFVRARYNLGVSCINIGCYTEAAQHLLGSLAMHQVEGDLGGGVNISANLWETLRRVFLCLDRRDLAEQASSGVDVNIFRKDFDF